MSDVGGESLPTEHCLGCGEPLAAGMRFCPACGSPVLRGSATDGERRHLTVMFADLANSTKMAEGFDPEDLRDVLRSFHRLCADAVARHEGHVARYMGDGVLIYFGYPMAHPDAAARAVTAGLEIVGGTNELAGQLPALGDSRIAARVGIHAGTVFIGEMGHGERVEHFDVVGDTPNIAARLQALASPGEVIISRAVQLIVGHAIELQAMGEHTLKGVAEPMEVYRALAVTGEDPAGDVTPIVGREVELQLLDKHWEAALAGSNQLVHFWGEPGVGKSRIVRAFEAKLQAENADHIRFDCTERSQHSAFAVVVRHVREGAGITPEDSPDAAFNRLADAARRRGIDETVGIALLASLLSVPLGAGFAEPALQGEQRRSRLIDIAAEWIVPNVRANTRAVIVEDLHWADVSTLEVLSAVQARLGQSGGLLVVTTRVESVPGEFDERERVTAFVDRIFGSQAIELVRNIVGERDLTTAEVEGILKAAEGIPLYLEQFARDVAEARVAAGLAAIPITLQDSLVARLDRLGDGRAVAQVASVIGREFSAPLLAAVVDESIDVDAALARLVSAGVVGRTVTPSGPIYRFTHSLLQRSAYESILRRSRAEIHAAIAAALVTDFPEVVTGEPELIAFHFEAAGDVGSAVDYLQQAAARGSSRFELAESIHFSRRALDLMEQLPASRERSLRELPLVFLLLTAHQAADGYGSEPVRIVQDRYLALSDAADEPVSAALARLFKAAAAMSRGDSRVSVPMADAAVERAEILGVPAVSIAALSVQCGCRMVAGRYAEARESSARGLEVFAREPGTPMNGNIHPVYLCKSAGSISRWALGDFAGARVEADEGVELRLADDTPDPQGVANVLLYRGWLHYLNFDLELSLADCRSARHLGEIHGMRWMIWSADAIAATAAYDLTPNEHTMEALERALGAYETPTGPSIRYFGNSALARAWHRQGRTDAALSLLSAQQEEAAALNGGFGDEEIVRSFALVHLERGSASAARAAFERGVEVAESRAAPGWLVRMALPFALDRDTCPYALEVLRTTLPQITGTGTTTIERMAAAALG